MAPPKQVRLPLAPLIERLGPFSTDYTGANPDDLSPLREALGVSQRTLVRWKRDGIPVDQADKAAILFGLHPLNVWGADWSALAAEDDDG